MMLAHLQKVPLSPSKRSALPVPACLDRAIMMCLAKEPAERPAGAEAFARMLESCDVIGSWTPEDAESWWRTNMTSDLVIENSVQPTLANPDALPTL
jgi:hypothetical protein